MSTAPPGADAAAVPTWERADGRSTLAAAREVWTGRRGARDGGEVAYLAYLAVMTALVLGVPALRALLHLMAGPGTPPLLAGPGGPRMLTAAWLGLGAAAALGGAVRGPVVPSPFFAATLASAAMPRSVALRGMLLRAAALLGALGALTGAVLGGGRVLAGLALPVDAVLLAGACAGAGLLLIGPWTLGQVLAPSRPVADGPTGVMRPLLAAGLCASALLALLSPAPWAIGAVMASGTTAPEAAAWTFALVLAGISTLVLSLAALDQLSGPVLAEQAARWSAATTSATTGDLVAAAGALRAVPGPGRRLPAVGAPSGPLRLPLLYLRRDLVGMVRTPERLAVGRVLAAGSAALLPVAADAGGAVGWAGVVLAGLLLWAASGAVCDGLRHAVATLGAPPLLGQGVRSQLLLHLSAPLLVLLAAAAIGAGAALAGGAAPVGLLPALLLVPLTLAGRARDAAKGPLPLRLAAPMPTAMGDVSVLPLLAWQGDAVLRAMLSAVLPVLAARAGALGVLAAAAAVLVLLLLELAHRIRSLSR